MLAIFVKHPPLKISGYAIEPVSCFQAQLLKNILNFKLLLYKSFFEKSVTKKEGGPWAGYCSFFLFSDPAATNKLCMFIELTTLQVDYIRYLSFKIKLKQFE